MFLEIVEIATKEGKVAEFEKAISGGKGKKYAAPAKQICENTMLNG